LAASLVSSRGGGILREPLDDVCASEHADPASPGRRGSLSRLPPTAAPGREPNGYKKQQLGLSSIQVTVDDRLAAATDPALSDFDFSSTEEQGGKSKRREGTANG